MSRKDRDFFDELGKAVSDIVQEAMKRFLRGEWYGNYRIPITDVYTKEDEVIIYLELPGIKKENIKADVAEDQVSVEAFYTDDDRSKYPGYSYARDYRGFRKTVRLPVKVDVASISAKFENGLLIIKASRRRPEGIRVEVE